MLRIDLHTHSHYSSNKDWRVDAVGSPAQMIDWARKIGLGGLAITDHNTVRGALGGLKYARGLRDFVFVPGVEISSSEGHICALGVKSDVPPGLSPAETIERIHDLGGIAVASHPFAGFPRNSLGDSVRKEKFDAIEAWNARTSYRQNQKAALLCKQLRRPVTCSSDAHYWKDVGLSYTIVDGDALSAIKRGKTRHSFVRMDLYRYARLYANKIVRNLGPSP